MYFQFDWIETNVSKILTKSMTKKLSYLFPILFLLIVTLLTWYIFFSLDLISDNEKRLTGVIALMGLGFGIFQFWMSEINNDRRKNYELRFDAYKEIVSLIQSVSETINDAMTSKEIIEVHGLVGKIMNQVNRIDVIMHIYNDFLFAEIYETTESKKVLEILEKILRRTDQFRFDIEKAENYNNMKEFFEYIKKSDWHNEMREILKDLHKEKYNLFKKLRSHF